MHLFLYNVMPPPKREWERQCQLNSLMPLLSKALCDHLVMSQGERKRCRELSLPRNWGAAEMRRLGVITAPFPFSPSSCCCYLLRKEAEVLAIATAAYEILLLHLQQGWGWGQVRSEVGGGGQVNQNPCLPCRNGKAIPTCYFQYQAAPPYAT